MNTYKYIWRQIAIPILVAVITVMTMSRVRPVATGSLPGSDAVVSGDGEATDVRLMQSKGQIALTFDDGPHSVYTPLLLEGLKQRGVQATFFLLGESIEGHEKIVRQMYEDGHQIGNHGLSHTQLTKEKANLACEEISRTNQKIYDITGEMPAYIRPPFGSWSEELECMVSMEVVLWNIDPLDWQNQNSRQIVRHVVKHADDGGIILLHDVFGTSVEAALEIVDTLSREGYNFVTVDELLID